MGIAKKCRVDSQSGRFATLMCRACYSHSLVFLGVFHVCPVMDWYPLGVFVCALCPLVDSDTRYIKQNCRANTSVIIRRTSIYYCELCVCLNHYRAV